MDTNNDWVKTSERPASEHAYPLFVWDSRKSGRERYLSKPAYPWPEFFTHWRCSKKVPPPPRELTQREKDEQTAEGFQISYFHDGSRHGVKDIALMAIHAERREILAALDARMASVNGSGSKWAVGLDIDEQFKAIRARLETQGD